MHKPRIIDITGDNKDALVEAMDHLEQTTLRVAGCRALGAILVDQTGHLTLALHPQILERPHSLKDVLDRIREACDMYEKIWVKNKIQ